MFLYELNHSWQVKVCQSLLLCTSRSQHMCPYDHTPLCHQEPISCPAGWRFDALGHDSYNHGDGNYKWPYACGKWKEGSLIKTKVLTRPPAGDGRWRGGVGWGCSMAVRRACNRSCWKWPETPKDRQEATSHNLSWPVTKPYGSLGNLFSFCTGKQIY